ncbi:MAG: ROK family protein [Lachnospiraceae bacterium]|nr:ROK family protein [Lachnospiraceae bacterium]
MRLGALEAGGTKMVCAIGDETGRIQEQISIPTTTPEETMPKIIAYFRDKDIDALGIAAFGPVDVKPKSPTYGSILDTPKLAWRNFSILNALKEAFDIPMGLDTDVNGSCLGEMTYGSAKGLDSVMYITIGTGIGAGIAIGGKLVHGMLHPEAGHILIAPVSGDENNSVCPYHKNCLEGLAAGPSIEKRWGTKAVNLVDKAEVWELESDYLAQAIVNFILTVSPQRIILGGGVMHQEQLFPLIRRKVIEKMNGYIRTPEMADMEHYIVPASLQGDQGIMGCVRLAELALQERRSI